MGLLEIFSKLFRNFMGLLMSSLLHSSSDHGDEDRDQTSRESLSPTPPPSGESSSSTPLSFEASSSSTLPSPLEQQYEVFLSFRGETRRGFTDHLYKRLDNAKVSVFRDKEGLPIGERNWPEIIKAIDTSKISIPIISPNYASSEWCLNELIQILKCKKMFDQLVIPIFYQVTPSDLRKKSYVESQLCKKRRCDLDDTHVQEWKDALLEVSYMTGLESKNIADGYEGELVEIVVTKVLKALGKLTLVVSDDLVGVDHHVEEIMKMVNVEGSNNVHAVLIYGMGGIGKTTLAKVIYNRLTHLFDCRTFLANIRGTWSQHKGNVKLQEQLILDILGQKQSISSVDEGVKIARDRFKYKKVLILLDDVDHRDQLNALANQWFGRGSMLIVTSRMKNVLKEWDGSFSYELNGLNKDQSFQLFCKHAFKKVLIPDEFHTIAKGIVSTTGGLPLAIEVIGSLLYGKNRRFWEEKLKKLKNIPDGDVQNRLKISFDALEREEQQIFLDIACLPIHEEREYALHMWESCDFYPELGIEKLISMSLIKIGEREELIIHDQLRDLGREIVRQESKSLGKRSRLWKAEEAHEVLESKQGTDKVEAICLRADSFGSEQFEGMTESRYIEMSVVDLTGNFKNHFQNLRWLIFWNGHWDFGESNLTPKKLVVLDLCWVNFGEGGMAWSQMKRLKVLKLDRCNVFSAVPDLSASKELEVLMLHHCVNVIKIHPSIGSLVKLQRLVIWGSRSLTEIPKSIGKLKLLVEIDLRCTGVTQLPDSIGDLCNLESLLLFGTPIRYLPTSIRMLSKLQVLDLWDCSELELLPSLPCSLTSLEFDGKLLETLPDFSNLTNLEVLHFKVDFVRCNSALDFRNLNRMQSLRIDNIVVKLGFLDSTIIRHYDDPYLAMMHIDPMSIYVLERKVSKNTSLLLELPSNLVKLEFEYCSALRTLPNFSNLKKLKDLTIRYCRNLVEINGLENAESIQTVSICYCSSLERIGYLSQLKVLTTLQLLHCDRLSHIGGMGISMTNLVLESLVLLGSLLDLSTAKKLKDLTIRRCRNLVEIKGLDNAKGIQNVLINECSSLERIGDLSPLKMLTTLDLYFCEKLSEIQGLENLTSLEVLNIHRCTALQDLPNLPKDVIRSYTPRRSDEEIDFDPIEYETDIDVIKDIQWK